MSVHQAIAHFNHRALAPAQAFHQPPHILKAHAPLHLPMHFIRIRAQHVNERDLVALCVQSDRLLQGDFPLALLAGAQAHEDFVSYRRTVVTAA